MLNFIKRIFGTGKKPTLPEPERSMVQRLQRNVACVAVNRERRSSRFRRYKLRRNG